jgi:hypothetical protein
MARNIVKSTCATSLPRVSTVLHLIWCATIALASCRKQAPWDNVSQPVLGQMALRVKSIGVA